MNDFVSKKYAKLHPPLVDRIYKEELLKFKKEPDGVKSAKGKLHLVYGAYVQGLAHKKAAGLLDELRPDNLWDIIPQILALHTSTRERLPFLDSFYSYISQFTGNVETVLDVGCGFGPFALPWIKTDKLRAYYAYDIDLLGADLLNRFFVFLGLPKTAACIDLAVNTPAEEADIALVCKLLPVLEAQKKGSGLSLLRGLKVKHLVVTYPTKSLGGHEKGMAKNYLAGFENAVESGLIEPFILLDKRQIGAELVFVLKSCL